MKLITNIGLIAVVVFLLVYSSCRSFEEFPDEPVITYSGFLLENNIETGITERGVLILDYTDGDGNIGLAESDTFPPFDYGSEYYYNMVITYFEMHHNEWEETDLVYWNVQDQQFDTLSFSARIPVLTPRSGNQAIKGFIQDTLYLYNPLSEKAFDTIKFSVFIIDRLLNKSNTVETPAIIVARDTVTISQPSW